MMYRIDKEDIDMAMDKISRQKKYLEDHEFITSNGSVKTLLDISMSANISPRYYSRLTNKVNTLDHIMREKGLSPVFLNITLDGAYHRLLDANYSRLTNTHIDGLPNSDRFGYLKDKALRQDFFTVRDLYQLIRSQWHSFQKSRQYMSIKKEHDIAYLFAVEPHESGVPHAHVLLYVPQESISELLEVYKTKFPAPRNLGQSRDTLSPQQIKNGEINGFQWTLTNPVGYIMKYCTKSFMDLKSQSELDELQTWYIKHKIIRLTTSHSLVPQWVYQKMYPFESCWNYLTLLNNQYECEWSREDDFIEFRDDLKAKVWRYDRGLYQYFQNGKLLDEFGEQKEIEEAVESYEVRDRPVLISEKKKTHSFIDIYYENEYFRLLKDGSIVKPFKSRLPFAHYSDQALIMERSKLIENIDQPLNFLRLQIVTDQLHKRDITKPFYRNSQDD